MPALDTLPFPGVRPLPLRLHRLGRWSLGLPRGLRGLAVPLAVLAAWWAVSRLGLISAVLLPSPFVVWETSVRLARGGVLLPCLRSSILLVAYGFLSGASAGFALGTLMGLSKTAERMALPLFNGIRQVPLVAWIPLLIIWCGIGETSKVIFIAIGASYPMVLNTLAGLKGVPREYIEVGSVFEYGPIALWRQVLLPAALPSILTGIRLSLSKSWTLVIGAEAFMATVSLGIGNLMSEGADQTRMDVVLLGIVVIGLVGLLMNQGVRLLERRFLHWKSGLA